MINGFTKALEIAKTDTIRYKSLGTTSALTLIGYYYNRKGDKEAAKVVAAKGLALDTSNQQMKDINALLNRTTPVKQQGGQRPSNNPPKPAGSKPAASAPKSGATVQKTAGKR